MVTALKLRKDHPKIKIGIIDCDQHYGNGTDNIISKLSTTWIKHYTFGNEGISPMNAERWLVDFASEVKSYKGFDVIFYQAGGDPHILDPLGGTLSTEQMRLRDEILFSTCSQMGIPVAWNLAGGYQDPLERVLELHKTTYEIALKYTK